MGGYRVCIITLGDCVCFCIIQVSRSHTYGIQAAFLHIICIYEFLKICIIYSVDWNSTVKWGNMDL